MTGFAHDPYEDTIELELTGEQLFGLSPGFQSFVCGRAARNDFVVGLTLAAAVVGITAAIVWRAVDWNPPALAVTSPAPAPVVLLPAAPAEPQGSPVQVRNPFDATEEFEFPAETTKTQAREAMAELLLQRARDRRGQGLGIKHAGGPHQARGAADGRPDVLVTRLSSPQPYSRNSSQANASRSGDY